jgi:cytochrome-b5 reductase
MLQVIAAVLSDPDDNVQLALLYANQSEEDILVREELETYQREFPDQLKVWYTLDRPEPGKTNRANLNGNGNGVQCSSFVPGWKYSSGFVSAEMIAERLLPPGPDSLVLMCGPPPMMKFACDPALDKLAYPKEMRFQY